MPKYAAPSLPAPWKPEKNLPKETSEAAVATAEENNAELAQALRDAYPDPKTMPDNAKKALTKAEYKTAKQIENGMHKATALQGTSRRNLHKLQEAKVKHRTAWLKHLKVVMETLNKQMVSYDEQQAEYDTRITSASRDIQVARREIQKLNALAAHASLPETPIEEDVEPDAQTMDQEELSLRSEVNELLQASLRASGQTGAIEIKSEDEDEEMEEQRTSKRPRSKDPAARTGGFTLGSAGK